MGKKSKAIKPTYYCPHCGCDDILFEARATWDQKKQRWDYFMDGGTDAWCGVCSEEVDQELEWGDPAEWVEPEEDEDDEDEEEDGDA